MYKGIYKIADHVFAIESLYDDVHLMCADYAADGAPEFSVCTSAADICSERAESVRTHELEGSGPGDYETDGYLETLAVYRKLCCRLLQCNILLIHGSCLAIDGEGLLFVARSGTGKSTHTRNWRKYFGSRVVMVNDDKPLLDVSTMRIYGTPWDGKHHISSNVSVQLRAVIEVARHAENSIRRIPARQALERMMSQTYLPHDGMLKLATFRLLNTLMDKAEFYVLECNKDVDSARVAYEGLCH